MAGASVAVGTEGRAHAVLHAPAELAGVVTEIMPGGGGAAARAAGIPSQRTQRLLGAAIASILALDVAALLRSDGSEHALRPLPPIVTNIAEAARAAGTTTAGHDPSPVEPLGPPEAHTAAPAQRTSPPATTPPRAPAPGPAPKPRPVPLPDPTVSQVPVVGPVVAPVVDPVLGSVAEVVEQVATSVAGQHDAAAADGEDLPEPGAVEAAPLG